MLPLHTILLHMCNGRNALLLIIFSFTISGIFLSSWDPLKSKKLATIPKEITGKFAYV